MEVKVIDEIEAKDLLDSFDEYGFYSPIGKFIVYEGETIVAIDNETGNAWTEEFSSEDEAIRWLLDPEIDPPNQVYDETWL